MKDANNFLIDGVQPKGISPPKIIHLPLSGAVVVPEHTFCAFTVHVFFFFFYTKTGNGVQHPGDEWDFFFFFVRSCNLLL